MGWEQYRSPCKVTVVGNLALYLILGCGERRVDGDVMATSEGGTAESGRTA